MDLANISPTSSTTPLPLWDTGGGLACLCGFVGHIISPKFLLLLKPAITEPSGNNLLFKGSLYRVSLFPLNIYEIFGCLVYQSDTRTNFSLSFLSYIPPWSKYKLLSFFWLLLEQIHSPVTLSNISFTSLGL